MEIGAKTKTYIKSIVPDKSTFIKDIEAYASLHNVPIMETDGMDTLLQFLRIQQPKRILEIGTAIGYSAIRMMEAVPNCHVVSIERDEERAKTAIENIHRATMETRFELIQGDALEVTEAVQDLAPFDVLFIDAAKGQYERFFSLYEPMVKVNGVIFSDNVLFKGMVSNEKQAETRRVRSLVGKIQAYNENLMNHDRFVSTILPVGDGLMVSKKLHSSSETRQVKKD
ncbi:SAM-dependent methyltransferase [Salipaludibacillus neizhouensis]|uniref:tRNA 5-hydroxyuridine methyltransferase n=1 Tax=Salipaludibacillus neizhouensis TaxID=885475 RepID=A0A3A9KL89_9BACI|nr:O-methyltransferase [Salipaludibacillus neizhouensis]RKL68595.1 SAM-dependent methyltransferase [Salipaludibacillus neizhouensis]